MPEFKDLQLNSQIISALTKKGYTQPTPIQEQAIPHILEGKDFLGIAQTGTGKTAAFSLPILDNLFKSNKPVQSNRVRSLILTPTRELASQIVDNVKLYGQDLNLKSGLIFGGVNANPQISAAKKGFDILVATPGRLLDLMNQGHIRFAELEIFVLDEADRMLDMGFINDVKKIIAKLPKERQTLFFSATMPKDVAKLADSILNNPVKVEVTPAATTVERIEQSINFVEKNNKPLLLKTIVKNSEDSDSFLVFSKTKHNANRICAFLDQHSIKSAPIHGNKSQSAREKALEDFRGGKIKVLVATDIAARGIDISTITHVINYELPNEPESYVHRIGRTGRAGRTGIAISFCDNSEKTFLKDIEKIIKMKIPVDENHALHGVESSGESNPLPSIKRGNSGRSPAPRAPSNRKPSVKSSPALKAPFKKNFGSKGNDENLSYFAQSRKKDADGRFVKPRSKPEGAKSRFNDEDSRNPRPPRPKFSTEGSKPRFSDEVSRPQRPRFNEGSKPRFDSDKKPHSPNPNNFGGRSVGFGEERQGNSNDRRNLKNPSENKFQGQKPRFSNTEDRRSGTYENSDRRSRFSSEDSGRDFRGADRNNSRGGSKNNVDKNFNKKPGGGFGGKPGGFGGNRRPTRPSN
ncbi:MAG: ATP-dependent RNA helicase RhlE [Rickettsiales bacterium]|jgi:ATP-dependent RNA helicase RhlE